MLTLAQRIQTPPLKCQGIKTKLLPFIAASIDWDYAGTWIEPFGGSGVVALNIAPPRVRYSDANPHIVNLYAGIRDGRVTPESVRVHLEREGAQLLEIGESHYYAIRSRFNASHDAHDFIFLNRSCFNGLMRFNRSGGFNVPFCRKPERFRPAYVTRIVNQVAAMAMAMQRSSWEILCLDWRECVATAVAGDLVYMDPPYIGRHADYYTQWDESEAQALAAWARSAPCGFACSMWAKTQYRTNTHLEEDWSWARTVTTEHFFHLGSYEKLRGGVTEALLLPA